MVSPSSKHLTPTRSTAHARSIGDEIDDILRTLVQVLGKKVVAAIVNRDLRTIQRWQSGKGSAIGADEQRILRDVFQIYTIIAAVDGDHTVRAWFLGMNPVLDDRSPVEVIVDGRARAAVAAARAFVNGA